MGTEMLKSAAGAFERKQRRCLDAMEPPNLFSGTPTLSVALMVTPKEGRVLEVGKTYRLCRLGDSLQVVDGVTAVAIAVNTPLSVLDRMRGIAPSGAGRVSKRFSMSGEYEIVVEQQ